MTSRIEQVDVHLAEAVRLMSEGEVSWTQVKIQIRTARELLRPMLEAANF